MLSVYKRRKLKRIISAGLIGVLMSSVLFTGQNPREDSGVAWANSAGSANSGSIDANKQKIDELNQKANKIAQDNKEREAKIAAYRDDISKQEAYIKEVNTQIQQIDAQINAYIELINAKQDSITDTELAIADKEARIHNIELRIAQRRDDIEFLDEQNNQNIIAFGDIAAQMYMNSGGGDTISLLTDSSSFFDVLVRAEMIRNIGERNVEFMESLLGAIERQNNMIAELEQDIEELEEEKSALNAEKLVLEEEMKELQGMQKQVEVEINRQYDALMELTSTKDDLQKSVSGLMGETNTANTQLGEITVLIAELEAENKKIEAAILAAQNPNQVNYSSDGFIWPVGTQYKLITCYYGWCNSCRRNHSGVDIGNSGIGGTSIFAMQSGTVIRALEGTRSYSSNGGYGGYVIVDHGGGVHTLYAHMQEGSVGVSVGQEVTQGQVIGKVGTTGWSTGNHLHFEVRVNGKTVNPLSYF
ncbi:MAG: peptidoglycan DD-metalloendopeptidase family protein [Oscillospiraceae bacterium]|nr:peptidoglycan DD-metalloendopeptidase family protein [Oscillospiraceae bacterium]